jgi:2',3'-cyclic-nucleotide 2'-phosphodiesterase (5'-nucleotidase family)
MGLDAFTLGNHEFDWGLETILQYADGNTENGEADFPFLGANVFYDGTTDMPEGIDPYTIIQKGTHKVGIIGTMGYGLESSIAYSKISDYEFGDPMVQIEYYSHYLRTVENCDVVIVVSHDSGRINDEVAALTGDYKVDAVFNGHSHSEYAILTEDNGIPEIQSGSTGEYVGYVKMTFDSQGIISYDIDNIPSYLEVLLRSKDPEVDAILEVYILETDPIFNTPIINSDGDFSKADLGQWAADLMQKATNSVIAFQNKGGTRTTIDESETINLGLLYAVWPFDNIIKTVELTGRQINALIATNGFYYSGDTTYFDPDTLYLVATNDYVFDKPDYPFIGGVNPINTEILLRDLVEDEMILQSELYSTFDIDNVILTIHTTYIIETTVTP